MRKCFKCLEPTTIKVFNIPICKTCYNKVILNMSKKYKSVEKLNKPLNIEILKTDENHL